MAAQISEREVSGERFLDLGFLTLVASKSEPGSWHEIRDGRCTCKGFSYRGRCRHITAALELAAPAPLVPTGKAVYALCSLADD